MDRGQVKEYDAPYLLMTEPKYEKGLFRELCMNSGAFDELVNIAKIAYETNNSNSNSNINVV